MKEPGIIRMGFRGAVAALLLLGVVAFPVAGAASAGKEDKAEVKVDYASAQQDILQFEGVLNEAIQSTFSASSFAISQKPKGAYVQGYGILFSSVVNIHLAVINTPFGQVRSRPIVTPELKKQRIEELKEKLIRVLQDKGDAFQQLRREDSVAVIVFVEDRNFPGEPSANKTIVLSILKKDLDELGQKIDRLKEFKQRMKIVEY